MSHTFHIPVLGLGFTIDTPLKVARYGISSVVSIVDDILIERMRRFHTEQEGEVFTPITPAEPDSRAKRITAYLNLLNRQVNQQFDDLKQQAFVEGTDITRYFDLLPDSSTLKIRYQQMLAEADSVLRGELERKLWKRAILM